MIAVMVIILKTSVESVQSGNPSCVARHSKPLGRNPGSKNKNCSK